MSEFNLAPGSTYRIRSVRTREDTLVTEGTFQGVTSMGSVDALVLELEEDRKRLIPTHAVLQLDVIEDASEESTDDSESAMYT